MIGTITPLVQPAFRRGLWRDAVVAYAIGSMVGSALTGAILGWLGSQVPVPGELAVLVVIPALLVLAAIEAGVVPLRLPVVNRQTNRVWRLRYSRVLAAGLWGLDIGTGLTTRTTYSSVVGLALLAVASRSPAAGIIIMAGYGVGRVLLVAAGPLLVNGLAGAEPVVELVRGNRSWHLLHASALTAIAVSLVAELGR